MQPTAYLSGFLIPVLFVLIFAYLLGSVSFSIILIKAATKDDIRNFGSGNAGATNVLRVAGKKLAALTFLLDFLKCVFAVFLGRSIFIYASLALGAPSETEQIGAYLAGFACVVGHIFPLYFGFRGGKGVVTTAAMMALVDWRVFVVLFALFWILFAAKKIVSLCSIISAGLYPVATFFMIYLVDYSGSPLGTHGAVGTVYLVVATAISTLVGLLVVVKHKENIKRLLAGKETPIISKK